MTKKVLVPIDINDPRKNINDFLYPDPLVDGLTLTGIKSGKQWEYGMVILTSQIDENDIFKRIVDSGKKIESVESLLKSLKDYVSELPKYKIGNILKLNSETPKVDFIIEYQRLPREKINYR